MGNSFTRRHYNRDIILMQGLSGSGKTSMLFKLSFGEELQVVNSHRETIDVRGMTLTFWDLYGREKQRPMIRIYYSMTKGFIYVIDSSDGEQLGTALDELVQYILLDEETAGTVVMVLANKQDIPGAMTALEIQEALKEKYNFSSSSASAHTVFVRACSVKTMEGVNEAFEDFAEQLRLRDAGKVRRGLLPLVGDEGDVKDGKHGTFDTKDQKESLARAKVKKFLKNPFCLFKVTE
ncbi:hypothetical protein RRG08_017909 [Elysia crispata]|uniref:ADP-ribosylation factor n=1 Tax=Elysia crispata TaxID=231223 RepID=A0AAE1DVX8_9GAST|nr:hypothetical protein RRG08_017909 [Elysia crispata]